MKRGWYLQDIILVFMRYTAGKRECLHAHLPANSIVHEK